MPELLARLGAVVRRRFGLAPVPLRTDRWSLDEERQCATLADGTTVALTATELRLLRCFMLHAGKLLSKAKLGEHVYADGDQSDSDVIEVYVNRLRRKLGAEVIRTQRGQGYVFGSP